MGYAVLCNQKLMLTNRLNGLQADLLFLQNQKQNLLDYSAAIADGFIDVNEIAESTCGITNQLASFDTRAHERARLEFEAKDENGITFAKAIEAKANDNEDYQILSDSEKQAYINKLRKAAYAAAREKFAQEVEQKRIAAKENLLDMEMRKIETKISTTQQELQSVQQAEAQAIQNATPKYNGVG